MTKAPSFSHIRVDGATIRKATRVRAARRGQTLVLFAMLCFALLGLAALIIDVGYARLARLQMQSASDSAALEALRFRDDFPLEWLDSGEIDPALKAELDDMSVSRPTTPQTVTDPDWIAWRDEARRVMARHQVRNVFDDDFQSDSVPNNYGAGPVVELDGGVGDPELYAGQTISLADEPVYKPQLQLNDANEPHGDIVSGTFQGASTATNPELEDYTRADFAPSGANYDNAALVRLRRSNESYGTAGDGVASNGPPVPYLFGRGSLMNRQSVGAGITVRATSIAAAGTATDPETLVQQSYGRVMSAGPPIVGSGVRGLTPFALTLECWNDTSGALLFATNGVGTATVNGSRIDSSAMVPIGLRGSFDSVRSLGQTYNESSVSLETIDPELHTFVPIYEAASGRIVGFGFVRWSFDSDQLTLTRAFDNDRGFVEVVAQGNATAVLADRLSAAISSEVLTAHRSVEQPLVAPVLVNSQ